MKITLLTQYYKPEIGAPQNRLYEMCMGFKRLGVDVSIITGMPNYPTGKIFGEYKGYLSLKEEWDGMEIKRYWLYASNKRCVFLRMWNMLSFSLIALLSWRYLCKRKNDYIIVESPPLTLGLTGWLLAKISGAKLVMNISDLWPLSAKELGVLNENGIAYKVLGKIERFLYRKSVFCMGQSQEIIDYIVEHGAGNAYLFRNGVDPQRFVEFVNCQSDKKEPLKIVYAGLLGFAQGILGICKSINFKELGVEFHIYGAGGEQNDIEIFLNDNPDKNIFYHGKIAREDIPEALSSADCTLIPLVKNIFGAVPSKIYESMAAGLPILFSGEGEGKRIIEENNLGWVSSALDYKALADNIKMVVSSSSDWKIKKYNCITCAKDKFNRPKQVKDLLEYLNDKL